MYHRLNCMKDQSVTQNTSPGLRAACYWFSDGLPDLVFGVALILAAAAGVLWSLSAPAPWNRVYIFPVSACFALLFWKYRAILEVLKSRITYPRTGYALPPKETEPPRPDALVSLALAPRRSADENVTTFKARTLPIVWWCFYLSVRAEASSLFSVRYLAAAGWLVPLMIVTMAAALYAANRNSEHPYRWWSMLVLALAGVAFLWVPVPPFLAPMLPLLLPGAWLAAQGAWTLAGYMRANPYPRGGEGLRA